MKLMPILNDMGIEYLAEPENFEVRRISSSPDQSPFVALLRQSLLVSSRHQASPIRLAS